MQRGIVFVILLLSCWLNAAAEESKPSSSTSANVQTPVSDTMGSAIFKPDGWSFSVYAGRYDVAEEPQFVGIRNKYGLGIGLSAEFAKYPNLGLDLELMFANRDYDTPIGPPLWGVIDNDTRVETDALLIGARAFYPANRPLRAYVSAGFGYFRTRMVVSGSVFGFPGLYEDSDSSLEPYYGMGINYMFANWGLSVDLRHFDLKGYFGSFGISNANLGGDLLLVGWKYTF
jgi:hypothetical protein